MSRVPASVIRRSGLFALVTLTTVAATGEFAYFLSVKGLTSLEYALLGLFALNVAWISLSFWTGLAGFVTRALGSKSLGLRWPAQVGSRLSTRTAILFPVHNEAPREVFARIEAMVHSLESTGEGRAFDFFILSDTTDPNTWIEEELEWVALCERLPARGRVHYRKRGNNHQKKAGNIADFCRRWGGAYAFFVVLDADSVMAGVSLVTLAKLMELNPAAGIMQAPPLLFGRLTLFARLQQFAGYAYGRCNSAGLAFWHLESSNYWGHNAIIRTQAFAAHCGLPVLPGDKPFGGEILSHDFVEAALMRRAGYEVWLVPEVEGSYEQAPPTLIDYAKRDRRWCQGNLQHLPLIFSAGLHPMSRLHFGMGVMSYLAAPLWLAFMLVGVAAALQDATLEPVYFASQRTLFPTWPAFDREAALRLGALCMGMLLAPKVLGVADALREGRRSGLPAVRTVLSAVLEMAWSVLTSPIHMVMQTAFVLTTVFGGSVSWGAQQRGDRSTSWREAVHCHRWHMTFGVAALVLCLTKLPALAPWFGMLAAGLLLSVPLSVISSRAEVGAWLLRRGLLLTEEEVRAPEVLKAAARLEREALSRPSVGGALRVLEDPLAHALHVSLLEQEPVRSASKLDATARRKLREGRFPELSGAELKALLSDASVLKELHSAGLPAAASRAAPPLRH